MPEIRDHRANNGSASRRAIRGLLVILLAIPLSLGWLLPVGAAPITATVCLNSSIGVAIQGAEAFFNLGGWQSIGFTDATGCVSTDSVAAAGNRTFRIAYGGLTLNQTQNTLIDPGVGFQTTAVNVRLVDSTGASGIPGAVIEYRAGSWQSLGTTDATGTVTAELLGVNTNFRVTHAGQTQTRSQNTGTNPDVVFQTTAVNVRLVDSTGAIGIPGAVVDYRAGSWQSLGTTDATGTVGAQLLGVNTNFRVTHAGQTQTRSQNTGANPNVMFQTGRVLQGTGPRILAYWASGWQTFTDVAELLPGNVTFDFDIGPNQSYSVAAGATVYVPMAPTAPVVTAANQSANQGESVVLVPVSFVDQEVRQTHRASIDWGDGSTLEVGEVSQTDGLAGIVTGSHVFADSGEFTVTICVSDDGNPDAEGCDTLQMTVVNLVPQVTIMGAPASVEEGSEVTLSSLVVDADPVTLSWTVAHDGTTLTTGTTSGISFTPADEGVYDVSLTADDAEGGVTTATGQVTVNNVAPVVTILGAPESPIEDEKVTLTSVVTDPGSTDVQTHAWTVTRDAVMVATGSEPGLSFTPGSAGVYVVTLLVNDGDGGTASAQTLLEVTATPIPEAEPAPDPELRARSEPAPEPEPKPTLNAAVDNNLAPPPGLSSSRDVLDFTEIQAAVFDAIIEPESTDPEIGSLQLAFIAENAEAEPDATLSGQSPARLVTLLLAGFTLFVLALGWLHRRIG